MEFLCKKLKKDESFEKRISITCSLNKAKCEFIPGKIIDVDNMNVSFIEPHKIIVTINSHKLLVLYFDKDNMFLYDRTMPINIKQLVLILKELNGDDCYE